MEENVVKVSSSMLSKVFFWMFLGLFATGIISWVTYSTGFLENILTEGTFIVMLIIEVLVVIVFSFLFRKLPPIGVAILFFIYAIVNGITLATIYYTFDLSSILYVLFAAALLFLIFAFLGFKVKKDLSKIGTLIMGVLIVAVIISVVNIFLGISFIDTVIDWVILIAFFGITAWDMQQIKNMNLNSAIPEEKLHIYGAMMLYLDFINIFLRLLSLFGRRD